MKDINGWEIRGRIESQFKFLHLKFYLSFFQIWNNFKFVPYFRCYVRIVQELLICTFVNEGSFVSDVQYLCK